MDFEKIGRTHLMMRLPKYRKQLSELQFLALSSLLEAYGIAVTARDSHQEHGVCDETLAAEHNQKCQAIEDKIVMLLTNIGPRLVR